MANVKFKEYLPSADLQPFVQAFWTGQFNVDGSSSFAQSVVPNGLIQVIVHMDDDHCMLSKDGTVWERSPDYTLIGLYKLPYEVRFSRTVDVFGIRFYPEGIQNIFGVPSSEFLATYEDGIDVLGSDFRDLCHRLRECTHDRARIGSSETFLREKVERHRSDFDYVHLAAEVIRDNQGMIDQDGLMKAVPISVRQLQREFKRQFGLTPKEYMRLERINAIQKYLGHDADVDLTALAYEHGFFDQPHFIREFKRFTGTAPGTYLRKRDRYIFNPAVEATRTDGAI